MTEEEKKHLDYLKKINFEKHLSRIKKKLKNKKIVLYGAGTFFKVIYDNFDLSGLDIIGISDRKYNLHQKDETFCGYRVCAVSEIKDLKPDYILVTTLKVVRIIENLYVEEFCRTKIKLKPLVNKSLIELWKEIWS